MKPILFPISGALALLAVGSVPAVAASARTFVSGTGNDTGNCARTTPCRSLAYAAAQTAPSGEVTALDPGGYGTLTINQSIVITSQSPGTASISVPSNGAGITITSGTVILRGIDFVGSGGGTGIAVTATDNAANVKIENCSFELLGTGVDGGGGSGNISVSDSHLAGFAGSGVNLQNTSGGFVSIDHVTVADATSADVAAGGSGSIVISKSTLTSSRYAISSHGSSVFVKDSRIANINDFAVYGDTKTSIFLDSVTITDCYITTSTDSSSTVYSYGNNNFDNNKISGPVTKISPG